MTFSTIEKLQAVERELKLRRRVYENRVTTRRMTQSQADYQIAIFEAVAADYQAQVEQERLL